MRSSNGFSPVSGCRPLPSHDNGSLMPLPERKPQWLRIRPPHGPEYSRLRSILSRGALHTVCNEALCPNRGDCWSHGRATIMILGKICTRGCTFCSVSSGRPGAADEHEPERVAQGIAKMGIVNVVLTSVTRDDLPDGGATTWAATIAAIRHAVPAATIEVLVPDFAGSSEALEKVLDAAPDILGHNLETAPSLYPKIRPQASYERSLELLCRAHARGTVTKTAVMVGLGETNEDIIDIMRDARSTGCSIFYAGQYLQPTREQLPVCRYVKPEVFDQYREKGPALGFDLVVAAPLARSSYHSAQQADYLKKSRQPGS